MRVIIGFLIFVSFGACASNATKAYCQELIGLSENGNFISQTEKWAASILGSKISKDKFVRSQNSFRFKTGFKPKLFEGTALSESNVFVLKSDGDLVTQFLLGPRLGVGFIFSLAPVTDTKTEAERALYGEYSFHNIKENLALSCVIW